MSALLDQSALTDLAERLVAAARKAGADAADAVAVRSVSLGIEIRDGALEESERSESDDVGLRVFVGRKQAVVSTNDIGSAGVDALAERAVAMARVAPEDQYAGLADRDRLTRDFPDLDLMDPEIPEVGELGGAGAHCRARGAGGERRVEIGRRFRLGRDRRHGAGDEPRFSWRLSQLAPQPLDDGDCRRRHRHGARLRYSAPPCMPKISKRRKKSDAKRASAPCAGSTRARWRRSKSRSSSIRASLARWFRILRAPPTAPRSRARPAS